MISLERINQLLARDSIRCSWDEEDCKVIIPPVVKLSKMNRRLVSGRYILLWGDIHGHCGLSDGEGTIEEYFAFAKEVAKLDFASHTPHDWNPGLEALTKKSWEYQLEVADEFNISDEFVTIPGYEWSSKDRRFGHRVVYFKESSAGFVSWKDAPEPKMLRERLEENGVKYLISIAHPSEPKYPSDFADVDDKIERIVEIYGTAGCFESPSCKYARQDERLTVSNFVFTQLQVGMYFGLIGTSDSHTGHIGYDTGNYPAFRGGLTGVWVEEFSREGVFDALYSRRTIASTGERICVEFRIGDSWLGSKVNYEEGLKGYLKCMGTNRLRCVDVLKNCEVWKRWDKIEDSKFEADFDEIGPDSFYLVRVEQEEGNICWCSPIWVR